MEGSCPRISDLPGPPSPDMPIALPVQTKRQTGSPGHILPHHESRVITECDIHFLSMTYARILNKGGLDEGKIEQFINGYAF